MINRKADINNNKGVIMLLLNILSDSAGFELNIKFGGVLKKIRTRMKFNKSSI